MSLVENFEHRNYPMHRALNWVRIHLTPPTGWRTWIGRLWWAAYALFGAGTALLQFADPANQDLPAALREVVEFAYRNRLALCLSALGLQAILGLFYLVVRWLRPIDTENVQAVLNEVVASMFVDGDHATHAYRATLFQIRGWPFLTGEWAGISARSGEVYSRSNTVFLLDREHPRKSTGWVGRCFLADGQTIVPTEALPVSNHDDYLRECGISEIEYRNLHVKNACLVFATGVRRAGKLWGFLVVDTTDPERLPGPRQRGQTKLELEKWAMVLSLFLD